MDAVPRMSATEATREVVSGMYDAYAVGDFAGVLARMSPDVVVHEPDFVPFPGDFTGHEGFARLAGLLAEALDMSTLRIERSVVEGAHCFTVMAIADATTGRDVRLVEETRVADGQVVEVTIYYLTAGALLG